MTEKQLFGIVKGHREHIADHTGRLYSDSEVANLLNELHEENQQMKSNGLNVLHFYENKLKNSKRKDFQSVRGEIWIVKQVLYEMGVLDD